MRLFPRFLTQFLPEAGKRCHRLALSALVAAAFVASLLQAPLPALAHMSLTPDLLPAPTLETVQFRNNQQGGGFRNDSVYRAQPFRPPVVRPPTGRPPTGRPPYNDGPYGRPPRRPGGWGVGPLVTPEYYPPQRPLVVIEDDEDEYVPPRRRRPKPVRRPVVVEADDDEPVVRRRNPRRAAPPVAARIAPRPPARPPVQAARRAPRLPPVLVPLATERRLVKDEILIELADGIGVDVVARGHGLTAMATERLSLANVTIVRYRIEGNRTARQALAAMAGDARIASAQPNFIYTLQQDVSPSAAIPAAATPAVERKAQYSLGKMGIDAAHRISRGDKVRVAVIDTAVDDLHPELEGVVSRRFDALAEAAPQGEGRVDNHGTAIAGAIIAKAALQGVSPAAELLVARAFTGGPLKAGSGAEGTTMHILKSLDWAHAEGARVVNLSFAGPQDRLLSRALQGGTSKGMIAIAAAGNAGPNSQPLYPGADASVIAVTATDADDKVFAQANTGSYVAVAAPGVDVIAAEPGKRYSFSSGTSMAAAHVSGLVALMLEQKPDLDLAGVRAILSETALDLGPKGRDKVFGAGRIDAPAALARTMKAVAGTKP